MRNLPLFERVLAIHSRGRLSHTFARHTVLADQYQNGAEIGNCVRILTSKGRFTEAQVRESIESLATEGHIYSTVDEDHYQFAM